MELGGIGRVRERGGRECEGRRGRNWESVREGEGGTGCDREELGG